MADTKVTATLSAKDKMSSVFDKAANKAGMFGGSLKSALGSGLLMGAGMKLFDATITAVTTHMDSAIQRFDTLNNFPKVMNNLGVSSKDAEESIDLMQNRLKGLPTTLDSAAAGVQRLTSKNGNIKKSTKYFLAMNDAIVAGGSSTEIQQSAIEQLSQAYSKGKMDMMEWRTLQMAMPGQLNQVAKAMNMTADELGEGLRNGSVSMDDFMNTLTKLDKEGVDGFKSFEKQALDATGGIGTAMTNLHTAITSGITTAMQNIDKALEANNLPTIGEAINGVSRKIGKFGKKVATVIPKLVKVVAFVRDHATAFKTLGIAVGSTVVAFKALKTGLAIAGAVKALGSQMAIMAGKAAATVPALGAEAGASTTAGSAAKVSAKGFMQAGAGLLMMGAGILLAATGFALLAQTAMALASAGAPALAIMGGMIAVMAGIAIAAGLLAAPLAAGGVAIAIFGAGLLVCGVAAIAFAAALAIAKNSIVSIINALAIAFTAVGNVIIGVINAIAEGVTSVLNAVANVFKSIGTATLMAGKGLNLAATALKRVVALPLGDLAASLAVVAKGMKNIAASGSGVIMAGRGMIQVSSGLTKIKGGATTAVTAIRGVMTAMTQAAGKAAPAGRQLGNGFANGMMTGLSQAKTNVITTLKQAISKANSHKSAFQNAGKMMATGLANGILSGRGKVSAAAASLAKSAHKTVVVTAKIGSPSRTFKKLGGFVGEGFAIGIASTEKMVRDVSESLVSIPNLTAPNYAMALSDDAYYGIGGTIEVPINLDGKTIASVTAPFTEAELNKRQTRANRKVGRI